MKLNKYSWLAVLPMFFTACQDDTLVENQQQEKIYSLSGTMDGGTAMSRAQIVIGNSAEAAAGETFFWNNGDSFDMYQTVNDEWTKTSTFSISNYNESGEGDKRTAMFTTNTPATAGVGFKAFYPSNDLNNGVSYDLPESLDFTNPEVDTWKEYFKNSMLMMATSESLDANNPIVEFKHLSSLARITYTNKSGADQTITYYCLNGYASEAFGTSYSYNVNNGSTGGSTADRCALKVSGLNVPNNESVDLYLLFFPKEFVTDGMLQVIIKHPSTEEGIVNQVSTSDIAVSDISKVNNNATGFEAGKRYWFKVTETANGLVWSKEYTDEPAVDEMVIIENEGLSAAIMAEIEKKDLILSGEVTLNENNYAVMTQAVADEVTKLEFLYDEEYTITNLKDIDKFQNLTSITCVNKGLQEAKLNNNAALTEVNVMHNPELTTLEIDELASLTILKFSETAVGKLSISETQIPNITDLYYGKLDNGPDAYVEDVNKFISLNVLSCYGYSFTLTNENIMSQLIGLHCYNTGISSIDLAKYPNLSSLTCYQNFLTELIIPEGCKIQDLTCHTNNIKELDLTLLGDQLQSLQCGVQKTGTMNLKLTPSQKVKWESTWLPEGDGLNDNVEVIDESNTHGNNFWFEEL